MSILKDLSKEYGSKIALCTLYYWVWHPIHFVWHKDIISTEKDYIWCMGSVRKVTRFWHFWRALFEYKVEFLWVAQVSLGVKYIMISWKARIANIFAKHLYHKTHYLQNVQNLLEETVYIFVTRTAHVPRGVQHTCTQSRDIIIRHSLYFP